MSLQITFIQSLAGVIARSNGTNAVANGYTADDYKQWWLKEGTSVTLTGFCAWYDPGFWCLTTDGYWADIVFGDNGVENGWTMLAGKTKSQSDAQQVVNGIIRYNKQILENNLLCARFAKYYNTTQKKQIVALQNRLEYRNSLLKENGLVTNIKTSYPAGYAAFASYLEGLKSSVGVATVAIIIVSAVVVAAAASACYWAYKYYYDQAKEDAQFSDELTSLLKNKLTAEEYEQLSDETQGLVTKATLKGKWSGLGSGTKFFLIAGVILLAIPTFRAAKREIIGR